MENPDMQATIYRHTNGTTFSIQSIHAEDTYPIRHHILRPHQSRAECQYPGDLEAATFHLGARIGHKLVGIASVYHEPQPKTDNSAPGEAYRLRGLATIEAYRGFGIGQALLELCIQRVRKHQGNRLWCNARTSALAFYRKSGFEACSEVFDIPGIGPHQVFAIELTEPSRPSEK